MNLSSPATLLEIIALVLAVLSVVPWAYNHALLAAAVILLAVALLVAH